ncbi:MAG: agglutinin biogenesis protein MshI [Nitrosomonadales bacterium]|nr:agglutinin biogenesis protein MshI [Nitrosomonadales bacterium]
MQIPILSGLFKPSRQQAGWFAACTNNRGVYFAQVQRNGNMPKVSCCSFHPSSSISPAALEKLCKDERANNSDFTTLLAPGEYQILMVDAPNVPLDELKTAVRWRIKDNLNYHVDDATVDVLQIPVNKTGGDRPKSLYAIAAANNTVQKRIELFEKAKMNLTVIDIPETAQRNVAALFEEEGRGLALLAFDDTGGMLTFTSDGELFLARRLEITLGQLQDADERQREQYLDRVELELQRSADYFGRQFHYVSLKRLLISAPEQLGLVQRLASAVDLPLEQLNLAQVLDISEAPELADSEYAAHMLPVLGAALRYERRAL